MKAKSWLQVAVCMALIAGSVPVCGFTPAGAEESLVDKSLEELLAMSVTTASKKAEKIQEAPAVVTVITAKEIKDFGANTLYDVIERLPSLQIVGSHMLPRNASVVRGDLGNHYDNHVLILINGRPFRDDLSGGENGTIYNIFPVDVIERIEFVRGPGSVLYGSDAFDGVINIITRKPEKENEVDVTAGSGSFGAAIGRATVGHTKGDLDVLANVNYFKDDGWDYTGSTFFPGTANIESNTMKYYNRNISGSAFLKYKDFTFNFYNAFLKRGVLGINPAWQFGGGEGQAWLEERRNFADVGYSKQVLGDYQLNVNMTYNYLAFIAYNKSVASGEGAAGLLGEVSLAGPIMDTLDFVFGGTYANMWRVDTPGAKVIDFYQHYYSGYGQVDYSPTEKLKITGGAQYNKPEETDGVTVPRIGAVYEISKEFGAKASYAEAFRAPWPMETMVVFPGVLIGNRQQRPEKVKTVDAQLFFGSKSNQSALTVFDSNYSDVIVRKTVAGTSTYVNMATLHTQGVELESKQSITSNLYVEGSATYQHEVDEKLLAPDYMVKAGVSYQVAGLRAGVFDNYFGAPKKNGGLVLNPEAKAIHYVSVNLNYTVPSLKQLELTLFVQNALDQAYYYPEFSKNWTNTMPLEPGRAVYGTATYKF